MTEVRVERGSLDRGVAMVYKDYGRHVRVMFDPRETTESAALQLLCQLVPRLAGAMSVTRHLHA
ncbi:hypothetical protein AB0K09_04140 [Streptomyces sp. NPDC049577]|uniref:hypothetical protein n=1 Tax=Streptomyces sp. NPDC049577 TaxID=3155153 RepID=UPI0034129FD0